MKPSNTGQRFMEPASRSRNVLGLPLPAIAALLLTFVVSLIWSHFRMFALDEFYTLQTDVMNFAEIFHIQRFTPLALDPLVYHFVAHLSISVLGAGPLALRLPSLIGYLTMQACLFVYVRRISNERVAIFSLAFAGCVDGLFYAVQGRPYGMLFGLCGIILVTWQSAIRKDRNRTGLLIALAVAIAVALNTHYYAVLLLVPLCLAELFRSLERKRLDLPVVGAIAVGIAGIVFTLPFTQAAGKFRTHYSILNAVSLRVIPQGYRALILDYTQFPKLAQYAVLGIFALASLGIFWSLFRQWQEGAYAKERAELVLLVALAALPIFGYLLARFVVHVIELRYVACALVGVSALVALSLAPMLTNKRFGNLVLASVLVLLGVSGVARILSERKATQSKMASLMLSEEIKKALLASPTQLLYFQDLGKFDYASYYESDPYLRSRMALVYSFDEELRWNHHDTLSLNAVHMAAFTGYRILPYEALIGQPGEHLFFTSPNNQWNWTSEAFAAEHVAVRPLGSGFGNTMVAVRFVPDISNR